MTGLVRSVVVALVAAVLVALPVNACARFTGTGQASSSVSSASLSAPTSLSTSTRCAFLGIGGDTVTVGWTASPAVATGYVVDLNAQSGTDLSRTVMGRTTTSVTVSITAGTKYAITVTGVYLNWTAASAATSVQCGLFG